MTENKKNEELLYIDNMAAFDYKYHAGDRMSRFFQGLKDKKIWANACPKCGFHSCPPRVMCGHCDTEMTNWVLQGDEGELISFNVKYYEFFHPRHAKIVGKEPWADGTVRLNGKAAMMQTLMPADPKAHTPDARYKVVWNDKRKGSVEDIKYYERLSDEIAPTPFQYESTENPPPVEEYFVKDVKLYSPYRKWYGATLTEFFKKIRDEKKLTATICKKCDKTYCMPKTICPECLAKLDEYVDISGEGTVVAYTIVRYAEQGHPYPAPYVLAIIKLDGVDNTFNHVISGITLEDIKVGLRVKPEFKVDRVGNILDIKYFKPL